MKTSEKPTLFTEITATEAATINGGNYYSRRRYYSNPCRNPYSYGTYYDNYGYGYNYAPVYSSYGYAVYY